ncbi:ATP-dependent protease ClpP protease subunit [Rathayibacter sp. PhB151]|uniref:head maturation protease, ClpP-related n=1 Tax=Rathayibacter sp. PhB151 TaxID=2485189 RepID=UPI0010629DEE|nr:head maturation protease, ClpP-related [Rathayibacter sp. PhB151]TDX78715.1 ATP-dependent protease ClpP protease subunit [Rathayibacter sp. PhB151]
MNRHARSEERTRSRPDMKDANRYWGSRELPTAKTQFFDAVTVPGSTEGATTATIRLYGPIDSWGGYWGVSAKDVGEVLDALPESVEQIILRINSPGGEVFEASTILNMFRAHRASVLAVVDGLAASAASFLAAGCDEAVMSPGTTMMIHSPSTFTWGNARDLRKDAEFLDTIERSIIDVYSAKAGEKDWAALLEADTWLTPDEAVELGLADRVAVIPDAGETSTVGEEELELVLAPAESDPEDAYARLSRFAAHAREGALTPPVSSEPGTPNRKEPIVGDNLKAGLSERLGTTDAALTDEQLLALVDEKLAGTSNAIPENAIVVDRSSFEQLQSDAAAGARALANQDKARRDGIVTAALTSGRITTASQQSWRDALEKDEEGIAKILGALPVTVPVQEIGHSDDTSTPEDSAYGRVFGETKEA